jgi:hypothetical protein
VNPFGFTPPDPDKIMQVLDNMKAAFQKAADADTGAAQPLFQSLSDTFNKVIEDGMNLAASDPNANPNKIIRQLMPVMLELQGTIGQLQSHAAKDPRVMQAMDELQESLKTEVMSLLSDLGGGIPGLGFPGLPGGFGTKNRPTFDDTPPAPPAPPRPSKPAPKLKPKPKKPGNGDFDF